MRYFYLLMSICFSCVLLFFTLTMASIHVPLKIKVGLQDLTPETKKEVECLAQNLYFESAFEPLIGQVAVAFVTLNRKNNEAFPNTFCEVVKQRHGATCQFSWFCQKDLIKRKNNLTIHNNLVYNDMIEIATNFYVNHELLEDPTKGALFYHADYVKPNWKNMIRTAYIGRHIFYLSEI